MPVNEYKTILIIMSTTNNSQITSQQAMRRAAIKPFVQHSMNVIKAKTMQQRSQRGNNRYTSYHAYTQSGAPRKDWTQFKQVSGNGK